MNHVLYPHLIECLNGRFPLLLPLLSTTQDGTVPPRTFSVEKYGAEGGTAVWDKQPVPASEAQVIGELLLNAGYQCW